MAGMRTLRSAFVDAAPLSVSFVSCGILSSPVRMKIKKINWGFVEKFDKIVCDLIEIFIINIQANTLLIFKATSFDKVLLVCNQS